MNNKDASHETPIKPSLLREFEFFGGCIRVKVSVKNISDLAILDAALELESDERILHFDRCEPEYPEKKGKILLGNINPNTDRTVAFYLDPLICAKEGTDVNCRVSFKDAFGRPDSVQMEPLKIKVVCPIFRTEQDINIGRLKELVSGLQFHDSKVYTIPRKVEISELLGTCKNVIQLHDVRHIKTFKTTDEKTYEAWYYGKTKVTKKDLVIKCCIRRDTESIEVFASGNDPGDITGLLAEIGRNLTKEFERLGKVQPIFNIHIKDSIIQRSNLLSFCDLDGTCGGDVVIEDSVVQKSSIASWNEAAQKEREEAQKREKEEQERLRRQKEQEERAQREKKAREEAERRERKKARLLDAVGLSERAKAERKERAKARQKDEQERIAREREKAEEKKETSWKSVFAVALVLGMLLIGYWVLAPSSPKSPQANIKVKSINPTTNIVQLEHGGGDAIILSDVIIIVEQESSKVTITTTNRTEFHAGDVLDIYTIMNKTNDDWRDKLLLNGNFIDSTKSVGAFFMKSGSELTVKMIYAPNNELISVNNITPTASPAPIITLSTAQKIYTNTIGMEFVLIPTGEFDMGSPVSEKDRDSDEGPVHRVKISKAFYMGKYEVTQKQWREIIGTNPSYFKGDNLPVELVSWNDVQEFIKKLNEKEGTNKYRLPSEAEWEYAARAGTTTRYSFGDDESKLGDYAWYSDNSGGNTHEVGRKNPNPWGLYDMHGNVWEWVQDIYQSNYIGAPTDGSAWEGDGSLRVARGGSLGVYAGFSRSASRAYDASGYRGSPDPGARGGALGFRLVRAP